MKMRKLCLLVLAMCLVLGGIAPVLAQADTVSAASKTISKKKAKKIAKNHAVKKAKIKKSTVRDMEVEKDTYKGTKTWEVCFEAKIKNSYYEFEYDIRRSDGKILRYEVDLD